MAVYRSGRSRTLVVKADWSAPVRAHYVCSRDWPSAPNVYFAESVRYPEVFDFGALRVVASYRALGTFNTWPAPADCSEVYPGIEYPVRKSLSVFVGTAFETTVLTDATATYEVGDDTFADIDPSGEISISAVVEEWFEVIDPIEDSDSNGFPEFGGAAAADGVTARRVRFFERLVVGSTFSVSFGGFGSVVWTGTVSTAMAAAFGEVDYEVYRHGKVAALRDVAVIGCPVLWAGEAVVSPYFVTSSTGQFDTRSGYFLELDRTGIGFAEGQGTSSAYPKTRLRVVGSLFSGGVSYPGSLDWVVQCEAGLPDRVVELNPNGSADFEQVAWSGGAVLAGVTLPSGAADTRRSVRGWLSAASLALAGDDVRDWRTQFRGRRWNAASLGFVDETELDDGSSASPWAAGANTSIVSSGGVLVIGVSGGLGSVSRGFLPQIAAEGYRFLKVRVRSLGSGSRPLTVSLSSESSGSKSWSLTTADAGVWSDVEIDLCEPDGLSEAVYDQEVRHPLDSLGRVVDDETWGVSLVASLTLTGLSDGETYEIDRIWLAKKTRSRGSWSPAFLGWVPERVGFAGEVCPFWWSDVDGRIADVWGSRRSGGSFSWRSVADWCTAVNGLGGWSASALGGLSDGYHVAAREAELLWGGGWLFDPAGSALGWNRDFGASGTVLAQALWDEVWIYPGAGSVFEAGAFGGETELHMGKSLRASAWGLNLSGTSALELRDLDDGLRGLGVVGSLDSYETGLPFGVGNRLHRVQISGGGATTGAFLLKNRMRHRRVFREVSSSGHLSLDWHPSGMHVRAHLLPGGQVVVGTKDNRHSGTWSSLDTGLSGQQVCVRWDLGRRMRIWLLISDGSTVTERFSDDLGENWSMAEVLSSSGKWPGLAVHGDGRRFAYWVSGGSVDGVIRDQSGATLSTVTGARTGVDDVGLAVAAFDLNRGGARLEMLTVEAGALILSTSSDGIAFS